MRNFAKMILALAILAILLLVARWLLISSTPEIGKAAAAPMPSAPAAATPIHLAAVEAPKVTPAPTGDKNEPSATVGNLSADAASGQPAAKAKYETDFGVIELQDGVAAHLTLDSGGTCEIRPTVLPGGNFKLVVILANPDPDTGEMIIGTPTVITSPGQLVWLGMGGEGGEDSPAQLGVSFTPKLKSP